MSSGLSPALCRPPFVPDAAPSGPTPVYICMTRSKRIITKPFDLDQRAWIENGCEGKRGIVDQPSGFSRIIGEGDNNEWRLHSNRPPSRSLERVMNLICRLHGGSHHLSLVSVVDAAD